ncbi:MAG TPA: GNAT family N-acetyltransferase [Mycobacteriales bacterium]
MTYLSGVADAALLARVHAFERAVLCDRVTDVVPLRGGVGVRHRDLPLAYDHNHLRYDAPPPADEVLADAETVLGTAGLAHRSVVVADDPAGEKLIDALVGARYGHSVQLAMVATAPAERGACSADVVALDLGTRVAAARADWRRDRPDWDGDTLDELSRQATTLPGAAAVTFLGVRCGDAVVARADVLVRDGVGQVEDVGTHPDHRGRGYATALVLAAVGLARARGAEVVFLRAEEDDWPRHLYRRLGFTDLGRAHSFTREPAARPQTGANAVSSR